MSRKLLIQIPIIKMSPNTDKLTNIVFKCSVKDIF